MLCLRWKVVIPIQRQLHTASCNFKRPFSSRGVYIYICTCTECPRRNVPDFGRVFVMLKYTDITQNTYVQSWTLTVIMAREKCGLLAGPHTVPVSWQVLIEVRPWVWCQITTVQLTVVSWTVNISAALWMVTSVLAFMCHV
jgi:hypothetical protein